MSLRAAARTVPERWRVVAALFTVTFCLANPLAAFGVFLPILVEHFGWSRGAVSVALSINLILGGGVAFGVAAVADRRGPRGILAASIAVTGLGFALASTVQTLWHFYLFYGALVGTGMSGIYILAAATVSRWFVERRGLALGIVLMGFNLGWLTGGPLTAALIAAVGWRGAYVALGTGIVLLGGCASLFVRFPTGAAGHRVAPSGDATPRFEPGPATLVQAAADPRFWHLTASWGLQGLVFMMVSAHSVPYAKDFDLPLERAALVLTAYGLGATTGRLASGVVVDRLGTLPTLRFCLLLQGSALAALILEPPTWILTGLFLFFGLGTTGADTALVKAVPDVFGLGALARIMSALGLGWRLGAAAGPAVAGYLHDALGSYRVPFAIALAATAASAVLFRRVAASPR